MRISIKQLREFVNEAVESGEEERQLRMRQRYAASLGESIFEQIGQFATDPSNVEIFRTWIDAKFGRRLEPRDIDQIVSHMVRIADGEMTTQHESCQMLADDIVSRLYAPADPIYF
jgi:hypothetical protein